MAAAEFSIRGYAASMRGGAAAGRRPFGIEDLPPMEAPRFRWWADELASAVEAAAAEPPRRSPGKAKAPKKRSITDLFAAAPPLDEPPVGTTSGGYEEVDVDKDEALCAIIRRTKEKKRKLRLEAAAASERTGGREAEGNFARKEVLDKPNLPDGLDTPQASKKPEGVQHLRTDKAKISDAKRRKQGKKKTDKLKYIENKKPIKAGKQRDLKKMLPLHSILKKYARHTSVKMVKDKHGNSKGTEVIELCHKSVRRVKFSEANDVLGSKKQSCKLPQLQSLCELFSVAMASSSSSSSTDMSSEGDKCITAESSSSHRPEKAFTKTKDANKNTDHGHSPELSNTELSSLIDLNKALPESTDLNYPYDSNSEVPNIEHTHDETSNSDVQVLDGRENQKLSFDSHGLECQPRATDMERTRKSRSAGTLLHGEVIEVSDTDIVGPPLSSRELAETHRDCSKTSVKDNRIKGMSSCALPDCTVHDSFQQHRNWFSTNLNHGGSQLSTGGEFRSCRSQECNLSRIEKLHFHSELNVQHECNPAAGQTVRLMGKDLAVSTTRGECSAETAQKHKGPSIKDLLTAKVFLELPRQGHPFLSLQAQNFPNVSVNSTSHVSANSASTSQAHFGYRTHNFTHPFPAANVFSVDRSPYEDRCRDCSDSQPHQNVLLGCPPLPNHGNASFHQNSFPPWRYYSDPFPFARKEPPSATFLPTTTRHATPSSVYHANLPQPYGVHSASSSVRPHNSESFTFSHPGQIVQEPSDSRRDAALPSRNRDNGNGISVPDNSNTSSSGRYVQRSGPVKLTPGAKHILMPSDCTGDSNSLPVYSCVSFGSRSGNASASQNKGAELYKF